jgi:hypothetical protein
MLRSFMRGSISGAVHKSRSTGGYAIITLPRPVTLAGSRCSMHEARGSRPAGVYRGEVPLPQIDADH